jgi:azurin
MRRKVIAVMALLSFTALSGCGRPAPMPPMNNTAPTDAEIPSSMDGATQVVQVTADDTMHFNGDRFTVKSGQLVRIELTNNGHRPREDMAHNFVVLKPDTDVVTFNLLSAQDKADGYVPPDQMNAIIAHTTSLAGPGETVVVEFTAPAPGQYPFLCNFPGHYAAGMHGIMTVIP